MHYQCIRTYCKDSGCSNTSHPFTLLQSVQPPDPHQLTNSANQNSDQLYSALLITSCFLDQVLLIVSKTPRVPSVSHHQDLEDQSSSHHKRIPPIDRRRLINPWKLSSPLYFHLCRPANVPINSATTSQHPMHFKLQKYHCSSPPWSKEYFDLHYSPISCSNDIKHLPQIPSYSSSPLD